MKKDSKKGKQRLQQSHDVGCESKAAEQFKDICPGCKKHFEGWEEGQPPCASYQPKNIYYDDNLKRFWCKLWT